MRAACAAAMVLWCWIGLSAWPGATHTAPVGLVEMLRIRIINERDGAISVSRDQGETWAQVGHVLRYTTQVSRQGYTASKWAPVGRVAATAVNAIHISAGYNAADDRGVVFSVLPKEMLVAPADYSSFLSPDSSIYTDIGAGTSIFGGGDAPLVGNQVYACRAGVWQSLGGAEAAIPVRGSAEADRDGGPEGLATRRAQGPTRAEPARQEGDAFIPITDGYVPSRGDEVLIVVARPVRYPTEAGFENWEGGAVWLRCGDGSREQLGWVVRPVRGIGRFLGGLYAGIGRIRANHTGVVDTSTSPLGELGGFQIIPIGHAISPEMGNAWRLTQWMIVGPMRDDTALWDGLSPLFWQHVRPDYRPDDLRSADWRERLLARFLVEVDVGKGWQPMPALRLSPDPEVPLPEWANGALGAVRRIRILFPPTASAGAGAVRPEEPAPTEGRESGPEQ